jgi:hypothetical protein
VAQPDSAEVATMGPMDLPTAEQRTRETEHLLAVIREEFPDVDVHEVFGGYEALPAGAWVIRSTDLAGILTRLRQQQP